MKMLRLKRGARYVIALEGQDGLLLPTSFWTAEQALTVYGLPSALWNSVPTEVYSEVFTEAAPAGVSIFVRKSRRGEVLSAVLWSVDGLVPTQFASIADASTAAAGVSSHLGAEGRC